MQGFKVFVRGLLLFLVKKKTFDTPVCPKSVHAQIVKAPVSIGSGLGQFELRGMWCRVWD